MIPKPASNETNYYTIEVGTYKLNLNKRAVQVIANATAFASSACAVAYFPNETVAFLKPITDYTIDKASNLLDPSTVNLLVDLGLNAEYIPLAVGLVGLTILLKAKTIISIALDTLTTVKILLGTAIISPILILIPTVEILGYCSHLFFQMLGYCSFRFSQFCNYNPAAPIKEKVN